MGKPKNGKVLIGAMIDSKIKRTFETVAISQNRTLSNLLVIVITDYLKKESKV